MAALKNLKHDLFAQAYAVSANATQAYAMAGYNAVGHSAEAAASRLLKTVKVQARVAELRAKVAEKLPQFDISKVEDRVKAAQTRWNRMMQAEAAADYTKVAPDALGRLMLATEEQAAVEMGQRKDKQPSQPNTVVQIICLPKMSGVPERATIDMSPLEIEAAEDE